ncbi:MAG: TRAP transporter substrate-binding protein DctP [Myxococcales bacterium]
MLRKWLIAVAAFAMASGAAEAAAKETITIATMAPSQSAWGRIFNRWKDNVTKDTNGEVELSFLWGGSGGDEKAMVGNMRSRKIDGAAITAIGLSLIHQDVLVFNLPGLFRNWSKLDTVRQSETAYFEGKFENEGFILLGFGDVGAIKLLSIDLQVKTPGDLNGRKANVFPDDAITTKFFLTTPGVTQTGAGFGELASFLQSKATSVIAVPPYAAEQMQWSNYITHINTMTVGFSIGAMVMTSAKFRGLSDSQKEAVRKHGAQAASEVNSEVRRLDGQAFARMKTSKIPYEPTADEVSEWRQVFQKTRQALRGATFSAPVFDRISGKAG